MIVEEALDKFNKLPDKHPYFPVILGNSHFVALGAVGPDYPYLSELKNNLLKLHSWADESEYEKSLSKLLPLKENLRKTDRLIDQIVYRLYGLTEEEIKIVEEHI